MSASLKYFLIQSKELQDITLQQIYYRCCMRPYGALKQLHQAHVFHNDPYIIATALRCSHNVAYPIIPVM